MTAKLYDFEGKQRTIKEMAEMMTCLHPGMIRKYANQGMTLKSQMLSTNPVSQHRRAGQKSKAMADLRGKSRIV